MPNVIPNMSVDVSSSKRGYRSGYSGPDFGSIPEGERFNPYDYISIDDYKSTKRGKAAYEEDLARLQYLADLAQQDWQNSYNEARIADERAYAEKVTADDREYNSYANQVALMREAGLNPDLLGVSQGSSQTPVSGTNSSASGSDVKTNPMSGMPTNMQTAGNIVSMIGSVAQLAAGLYSGGLSAVGATLSNAATGVDLISKIIGSSDDWQGVSVSNVISGLPLSRSRRKSLNRIYDSVFGSPRHERGSNKFWTDYKTTEAEYEKSRINPLLNPSDSDGDGIISTKDWSYIWEPIFDAQFDIMNKELSSRKTDLLLDSKRFSQEESELDYMAALKGPMRETLSRIKQKYDEGNEFYGFLLTAIYALLSNSFSFSSSSSSTPKGEKSSFSFGIK